MEKSNATLAIMVTQQKRLIEIKYAVDTASWESNGRCNDNDHGTHRRWGRRPPRTKRFQLVVSASSDIPRRNIEETGRTGIRSDQRPSNARKQIWFTRSVPMGSRREKGSGACWRNCLMVQGLIATVGDWTWREPCRIRSGLAVNGTGKCKRSLSARDTSSGGGGWQLESDQSCHESGSTGCQARD